MNCRRFPLWSVCTTERWSGAGHMSTYVVKALGVRFGIVLNKVATYRGIMNLLAVRLPPIAPGCWCCEAQHGL